MKEDIYTTKYDLIQKIQNIQDDNAWHEFQQFYWDIITGWAIKAGCSNTLAKDIFQETVVSLIKAMSKYNYSPDKGSFRGFLKTIVMRRVSDAFRKEKQYINLSDYEENNVDLIENIEGGVKNADVDDDNVWLQGILEQSLRQSYKRIDELTYKSFCLYVLENTPVKEVCEKLSIKRAGTVYQHKNRFLGILKESFCLLLEDLGEVDFKKNIAINDNAFTKLLEELIVNRPDFRETVIHKLPPVNLLNQIDFIKPFLQEYEKDCVNDSVLLILHKTSDDKYNCKKIQKLTKIITIGRSDDSTIILNKNGVSGLHSTIKEVDKDFIIIDKNSTNGVFLNNNKIMKEEKLHSGDIIQITDNYLFIVSLN